MPCCRVVVPGLGFLVCGSLGCGALLDLPDDPRLAEPEPGVDVASDSSSNARPPPLSDNVSGVDNVSAAEGISSADGTEPSSAVGEADGPDPDAPASPAAAPDGGTASSGPRVLDAGPGAPPISTGGEPASGCAPIERPVISDFRFVPGADERLVTLGADASFAGNTFFYPEDGTLTSDVSADDWHLSGTVASVSGFGLVSSPCRQLDASAYAGIEFLLSGQVGVEQGLTFFVETASNQVSHVWLNQNKPSPAEPDAAPNFGRCTPATGRYDGTCREARVLLPVPVTAQLVRVFWDDFTGGSPAASVDPREITSIAWSFRDPGGSPYAVDIRIDDLRFITP